MVNAQELLNKEFSNAEKKSKIKEIMIYQKSNYSANSYETIRKIEDEGSVIRNIWTGEEIILRLVKDNVEKERWVSFNKESNVFTYWDETLMGELVIENFPNLERLIINDQKITSLKFFNCSYNNDLIHLKINCLSLEVWQLDNNEKLLKLDYWPLPNLTKFLRLFDVSSLPREAIIGLESLQENLQNKLEKLELEIESKLETKIEIPPK